MPSTPRRDGERASRSSCLCPPVVEPQGGAPPVRILTADDHAIFRDGLRKLLEEEPGFAVVGEARDGQEAVDLAQASRPDVVLLDLAMPQHPGMGVIRQLAAIPGVRVLVLTAALDRPRILDALERGARGVVLKETATQLLMKAIRTVMAGELWVGRDSVADLVAYVREGRFGPPHPRERFHLTPREHEIVRHIVDGSTNRDIATRLGISEDTVKHHLRSIFDKLGVSNRLELALFVINHRIVDRDV